MTAAGRRSLVRWMTTKATMTATRALHSSESLQRSPRPRSGGRGTPVADKTWHRANPDTFERLKEQIAWEYPELHFVERGDQLLLNGIFPIAENGRVVDRYRIEILISPRGPRSELPVVKEVAGRI